MYALKYGRKMKPTAREKYIEVLTEQGHTNVNVRACSLFVHPEYIFLRASPDGIMSCDCYSRDVLEIKCPSGLFSGSCCIPSSIREKRQL